MSGVVTIGGGGAGAKGELGTVYNTQGELPPIPEVKDEELDVLVALASAVAGDDAALVRAVGGDVVKRTQMIAALSYIPDEAVRLEMQKTIEQGLGDQVARESILAGRPYFKRASEMLRDFRLEFERVEEHGRGVRLAARWTQYDPIQGRDFPAEQFSYPRGSLGKIGELAEFIRATLEQLAVRAFHATTSGVP